MIPETIINIDSPQYTEAEYDYVDCLTILCVDGTRIRVFDFDAVAFIQLVQNPAHNTVLRIFQNYPHRPDR